MLELLKIAHLLSMVGAMGMTTAALIGLRYVVTLESTKRPIIPPLQQKFANVGAIALILLWITGLALFALKYKAGELGGWFALKIVCVIILTGLVVTARRIAGRAKAEGAPPPVNLVVRVLSGVLTTAILVVVFAVLTFS